ncbi:MAG: phenylalanine--tRNA ligase subunit beta [Bacilli bacterium]|nr:phenylalanine--tRNA ligase subunit beta [Bacilli bacterium]
MLLSRKFVSEYVDLPEDLSIKQIADDMTSVGNEYDSAQKLINCTNLTVGEVIECEMHPDSDHLHCCKVNVGDEILDIVCGAPNVRKGLKVIVALDGAKLPGGEIKKGMIRGQVSNGMLCSKAELGIDNKFLEAKDKEGIHELPSDAIVGSDPIKLLGLDDEVIDFELTSNRGDLLSILGMAYELGAIYRKNVKDMDLSYVENNEDINNEFKIDIQTEDCTLFLAKKVKNITIKESPDFIKSRLIASGIRPINNVVDISNYVMLETGQPLHFYDSLSLGNTLIVRNANEGETLTTLDGILRTLNIEDIVISNERESVGLAGVMGGLSTEVEDNTKEIIIESAIFNSIKIRKTSKKILRSEASNRFEKGLDPKRTYMAIDRCCNLLEKYADATIVGGMVIYDNEKKEDKSIDIKVEKINKVLGVNVTKEETIEIFEALGFKVFDNNDYLTVVVPSRRLDIKITEDLIEEVGRIYGMDKIEGKLPVFESKLTKNNNIKRVIRNWLVDKGLNETLSYSLIPIEDVHKYTLDEFESISLADPMSEDRNTLRYSLLSSLKQIYDYNNARNNSDISIFEIGKSFYKENGEYKESNHLAILMSGDYYLDIKNTSVDFYVIKGIVEELLDYLGYTGRYSFDANSLLPNEFHPGQSANIIVQGEKLGIIGKLHPNVSKKDIFVFEINLDKLLNLYPTKMTYKDIPKYPSIVKDVAFIIDKDITNEEIVKVIKKNGGKLLVDVLVFDIYTGDKIDKNKKSLAYNLTFRDNNKTLTEDEVMVIFNNIIRGVENKFNAVLRDK